MVCVTHYFLPESQNHTLSLGSSLTTASVFSIIKHLLVRLHLINSEATKLLFNRTRKRCHTELLVFFFTTVFRYLINIPLGVLEKNRTIFTANETWSISCSLQTQSSLIGEALDKRWILLYYDPYWISELIPLSGTICLQRISSSTLKRTHLMMERVSSRSGLRSFAVPLFGVREGRTACYPVAIWMPLTCSMHYFKNEVSDRELLKTLNTHILFLSHDNWIELPLKSLLRLQF